MIDKKRDFKSYNKLRLCNKVMDKYLILLDKIVNNDNVNDISVNDIENIFKLDYILTDKKMCDMFSRQKREYTI